MKKLYYLLVTASICLVSCMNCTWVQTDYYYDDDGEAVEEGYYDCPEDNPVEHDFVKEPKILVTFNSYMRNSSNENHYKLDFSIFNFGNANAVDINVFIKISRHSISGNEERIYEFERYFDMIQSPKIETISYTFSDISYTGKGLYDVMVNIEYKDDKGKSSTIEKYFEF